MTREQAIQIIHTEYKCVNRDCSIETNCGKCDLMMPTKEPILEAYKMAISALSEPKQGEWVKDEITERSKGAYKYKCSICEAYHRARYNYCPSCGAQNEIPL